MENDVQAAVIGSGMIGLSMAVLLTGNGVRTKMFVRNREKEKEEQYCQLMRELEIVGILTGEECKRCSSYFTIVTSYEEIKDAEVVFECAAEKMDVKQSIYEQIFKYCPFLKVIASTTSAISSQSLAENSNLADKLLVAHPFYPPHLISCVEIVPNSYTDKKVIQFLVDFLQYLGREPVILKKDATGFVANRLQYAMLREAVHIVEEGIAEPEDVDRILMKSFAPRYTAIGIFEHFDNCGLDLTSEICKELYPELSGERSVQKLVQEACNRGEFGVRTQKGFYNWAEKDMEEFQKRIKQPYINGISWNVPQMYCI